MTPKIREHIFVSIQSNIAHNTRTYAGWRAIPKAATKAVTQFHISLVDDMMNYAEGFMCWGMINRMILDARHIERNMPRSYYEGVIDSAFDWEKALDDAQWIDNREMYAMLDNPDDDYSDWEIKELVK